MSVEIVSWVPVATALVGAGGALGSQLISHCFTARREKQSAEKLLASERAYIGSQLMIILAEYREECNEFSCSAVNDDNVPARPGAPDFSRVKGDWSVLDGELQLRIHRIAFIQTQYEEQLKKAFTFLMDDKQCRDFESELYQKLVVECDRIIENLGALCALPSPWSLDE